MNMIASTLAAAALSLAAVAPAHSFDAKDQYLEDLAVCDAYGTAVTYVASLQQNGYTPDQVRAITVLPGMVHKDWVDMILSSIDTVYDFTPPPFPTTAEREAFLDRLTPNYVRECMKRKGH